MRISRRSDGRMMMGWKKMMMMIMIMVEGVRGSSNSTCSCTPTVYRWQIDFNRTCEPLNIDVGLNAGVAQASCQIETDNNSNNSTNVTLTNVVYYQILELGPTLAQVLKAETSTNGTTDNTLQFASITSALPNITSVGLQVFVRANTTQPGIQAEMQWIVRFTNNCDTPVFNSNNSIGWLVFQNSVPARDETCQAPSDAPSLLPSKAPSLAPTASPSNRPSIAPSMSDSPSVLPSLSPTNTPSSAPSSAPSNTPSNNPSNTPSSSPSSDPSSSPSSGPSSSPSSSPTRNVTTTAPTPTMTVAPTSASMSYPTGSRVLFDWDTLVGDDSEEELFPHIRRRASLQRKRIPLSL